MIETRCVEAEESLVEAAVAGDVHAFAALYDKHLDRVYRYVDYRVRNRADAEDLTQQVFLKAWVAISRYTRTGAPFAGWLLTIAHNLVVNFLRQAKPADPLAEEPTNGHGWADGVEAEVEAQEEAGATGRQQAAEHLKADLGEVQTQLDAVSDQLPEEAAPAVERVRAATAQGLEKAQQMMEEAPVGNFAPAGGETPVMPSGPATAPGPQLSPPEPAGGVPDVAGHLVPEVPGQPELPAPAGGRR